MGEGGYMLVYWHACINGHQLLWSLLIVAVSSGTSHMIKGTGNLQTFFGVQGSDAQLWMDIFAIRSFLTRLFPVFDEFVAHGGMDISAVFSYSSMTTSALEVEFAAGSLWGAISSQLLCFMVSCRITILRCLCYPWFFRVDFSNA